MAKRQRQLVDDGATAVTIGGRDYLVSQMTMKARFAIQRAAAAVPGPTVRRDEAGSFLHAVRDGLEEILAGFAEAVPKDGDYTEAQRSSHLMNLRNQAKILVDNHLAEVRDLYVDWPGQVGTPEMMTAFMNTEEGVRLVTEHALRPLQPEMTAEDFERVYDAMTTAQFEALFDAFFPTPRKEEEPGPKAPAAASGPGGGPTSTPSTSTNSTAGSPASTAGPSTTSTP